MCAMRRALGIMGKAPISGSVKTRLNPPLSPDQAALLYSAFLRDAIVAAMRVPDCMVSVVHNAGSDTVALRALAPARVALLEQPGKGLGDGLLGASRMLREAGVENVVITSSDSPSLPAGCLVEAFEVLEARAADVVLGPSDDGGYYCIGMREDHPELFAGISWSSERVTRQTLERAAASGLSVHLLTEWYDIDDVSGLLRLIDDLGRDPCLDASATRAALQTLRRLGVDLPAPPVPWSVSAIERAYASPWRNFDVETLQTHSGAEIRYGYASLPDAVWIVPVTSDGYIILVRQYRGPVRDWCLEVPCGSVVDEPLHRAAERELREEAGARGRDLRYMGAFYASAANQTLRCHVFLALDVELGAAQLEDTELLVPVHLPAEVAFDMARRGEINEGESALAVLMCEQAVRAHLDRGR